MRALMTRTRTVASRCPLYLTATSSLLVLAVLLGSWASTSHANPPGPPMPLEIVNFIGNDLGYYDMYTFSGTVQNAQDPASLTVSIYINGNLAGTTQADSFGDFEIDLECTGGEVVASTTESGDTATATITLF